MAEGGRPPSLSWPGLPSLLSLSWPSTTWKGAGERGAAAQRTAWWARERSLPGWVARGSTGAPRYTRPEQGPTPLTTSTPGTRTARATTRTTSLHRGRAQAVQQATGSGPGPRTVGRRTTRIRSGRPPPPPSCRRRRRTPFPPPSRPGQRPRSARPRPSVRRHRRRRHDSRGGPLDRRGEGSSPRGSRGLSPHFRSFFLLQLEPYMDENFLSNAMIQMGQDGVVSIKVRRAQPNSYPRFKLTAGLLTVYSFFLPSPPSGDEQQVHGRARRVRLHQLRV